VSGDAERIGRTLRDLTVATRRMGPARDPERTQRSPDEARREWSRRFVELAREAATAWWATDDERDAWRAAGGRVAQAAGLPLIRPLD
jgi:hypothetical protein